MGVTGMIFVTVFLVGVTFASGQCFSDFDCNLQGTCENGTCFCDLYYTADNCSYRRKSRVGAALLSGLFGYFGVDRFYLGYIGIGVVKLLFGFIIACFGCVGGVVLVKLKQKGGLVTFSYILSVGGGLGIFIWWLVDFIRIAIGHLDDSNGVMTAFDF